MPWSSLKMSLTFWQHLSAACTVHGKAVDTENSWNAQVLTLSEPFAMYFVRAFHNFEFRVKSNGKVRHEKVAENWPVASCFSRLLALFDCPVNVHSLSLSTPHLLWHSSITEQLNVWYKIQSLSLNLQKPMEVSTA